MLIGLSSAEVIRIALELREKLSRLEQEERRDGEDIDPETLKLVRQMRRQSNRLLQRLYERDQRWEREASRG
jgi:hypothetical protein